MEPLGCVVYSHCPINDSYKKCICSCCLPCNYVTRPFGILQRVIKSQKVYIYHLHTAKVHTFSLRKVCGKIFRHVFKFSGLMKRYVSKKFRPYQCALFKKRMFLLCLYEEITHTWFYNLISTF